MPAIANGYVSGSGELTTASLTFVDALCTSPALDDGVEYVVIGLANHRNNGAGYASELEYRFGTTRLGVDRFRAPFGAFNLGDDAAGSAPLCVATVTGDGSSTLNMRARGEDSGGADVIVGAQSWLYFSAADFVTDLDIVAAELTADAETARPTSSTWVEGAAGGQARVTPATTGDWLILAVCEGAADVGAAATNEFRVRLVQREDPDGAPSDSTIGSGEQYHDLDGTDPDHYAPAFGQVDVVTLTGGVTYDFLWEFSNVDANAEISYRREKVIAIRLGRMRNASYIVDGSCPESTGAEAPATTGLTFDFSSDGGDVFVLGSASYQNNGTWGDAWIRREGTPDVDIPGGFGAGRFHSAVNTTYAGDIITIQQVARVASVAAEETFRLVVQGDTGAGIAYGRARGNGGDSRALVLALEMFAVVDQFALAGDVTASAVVSLAGGAAETLYSDGVTGSAASSLAGEVAFAFAGDVTSEASASLAGDVVFTLAGDVVASAAVIMAGGAAEPLAGDASASAAVSLAGSSAIAMAGDVTASTAITLAGTTGSDAEALVGAAGQTLALGVLGINGLGVVEVGASPSRLLRFRMLSVAGSAIPASVVETIEVKVRRQSDPAAAAIAVTPIADSEEVDGVAYQWSVSLAAALLVSGMWVLEVDATLTGGVTATWPSAGPQRIRVLETVD